MPIKFKKLTPDLMVSDVAKTVKFYTSKLGFKLDMLVPVNEKTVETHFAEDREYVYAMVSRDEVFVMFMRREEYVQDVPALKGSPIGASAAFYCDVDNVSALCDAFKANGVDVLKDVSVTWYGMREFYIRDCNGYILGFAEQAK